MESAIKNLRVDAEEPAVCSHCGGCGLEDPDGKGRRPCRCRREKLRELAIARIPERNRKHGVPVLAELKPIVPREHEDQSPQVKKKIFDWQAEMIEYVRAHPFDSLNLCGKNKIGKSQIGYALYLNAFEHHRVARCFKLAELLADYQKATAQNFLSTPPEELFVPRLTTEELGTGRQKYTILIDEFHNPIPSFTEAQMRTVSEILDAIKANSHQLIVLSNFPYDWLQKAMYARRSKLGEACLFVADMIMSRISEDAVTEELFF